MKCISFFAFSILSFSLLAMERDLYDYPLIANTYKKLVIDGSDGQRFREKNNRTPLAHELGTDIETSAVVSSFFRATSEFIEEVPEQVTMLYKFFLETGFIYKLGFLNLNELIAEKKVDRCLRGVQQKMTNFARTNKFSDTDKIAIIPYTKTPDWLFHSCQFGFFLRNKNKLAALKHINNSLKPLFIEEKRLRDLVKNLLEINDQIFNKVKNIESILTEKIEVNQVFLNLEKCPDVPAIYLHQLKLALQKHNQATMLSFMIDSLALAKASLIERQLGIDTMVAAPIDILLLYFFYLFEESKSSIVRPNGVVMLDLMNSFGDIEELSFTAHLSEYAHQLMEQLGISFQKKPPAQKPNRPKNQSNKQSASLKKKKKSPGIKVEEQITAKEPVLESTPKQAPTAISNVAELVTGKYVSSLADNQEGNIKLKLSKGHRLLDTMARLLASEMAVGEHAAAGSVSLALIENGPQLLISTKNNRVNADTIQTLKNVVIYSEKFAKSVVNIDAAIKELKIVIKNIWLKLKTCEDNAQIKQLINEAKRARTDIDKLKLFKALNSDHKDTISLLFKFAVLNASDKNIIVLHNPFNLHSELNAIEYIKNNGLFLGHIKSANGKDLPYQYIGGSLLNCGKCKDLIKGNKEIDVVGLNNNSKDSMLFFSRGNYHIGYPNFLIPQCAVNINKFTRAELGMRLDISSSTSARGFPKKELVALQEAELSDSDEDR